MLFFRRKKKDVELPPLPPVKASLQDLGASVSADNMKAKMDLVLTQMESISIKLEALNQRMNELEVMVKEIFRIAKTS